MLIEVQSIIKRMQGACSGREGATMHTHVPWSSTTALPCLYYALRFGAVSCAGLVILDFLVPQGGHS